MAFKGTRFAGIAALAPSIAGAVLAVGWGIAIRLYFGGVPSDEDALLRLTIHRPWAAFGVGAVLGLVASLFEARHLARNAAYFAKRPYASAKERAMTRFSRTNTLAWAPTLAALALAAAVGALLRWSVPMAVFGSLVPSAVTYPIERRIHRRPLDRL